ncbi:SEL1-like repeat protein [Chryseobacterium sp. PMSZPI]|uniref:SEL1-like repeat protein n=1 Tax=Chryseobacterium sp. PMSZPI TaxID=1033900 RepID=UPI000C329AAB|nr:SEL1-like repeat protein [Chryseobacterium sp. PMSZPI]PKF75733.1 hypothetical protein CW752_02565 [Chryseobacterium sp. PMSZPI]
MAHRIYVYNIDSKTKKGYSHYLGEWNYEIPELLLPLFSCNPRSKGKLLYFDKENGVARLKSFYQLLGEHYQLLYKKAYYEPVNKMFDVLDTLPYDTFVMNATDVFNMNEERHSEQAKDWVLEIQEKNKLYDKAMAKQDLVWLEKEIFARSGYESFLELLETDWIDYGLGYWNEELYKNPSDVFEENNLWGLKDKKGNIGAPPIYEEIFAFSDDGIAVAQKNGTFGYLRNDGKVLVECTYEDAFDPMSIEERAYGIVQKNEKLGLIDITLGKIVIPFEYDDLDKLLWYKGLFNAKKEDKYRVIDLSGKEIITDYSEAAFEHEYPDLIYRKQIGTSKRAYYTFEGIFLGEYPEKVLSGISNGYYFAKPNKFQKKINIIKSDGSLLDYEVDTIMVLGDYGYTSFIYKKAKEWFIYSTELEKFRLSDHTIENYQRDWYTQFMRDIYLISDVNGWGIYNASEDYWLLPSSKKYKKIEACKEEIFRITTSEGMFYYDQKTNTRSNIYDYVCEGLEYHEQMLCLFKGQDMFILNKERELLQVSDSQMGTLYEKKYNLRGKDQKYFLDFYKTWTENKGLGYEMYFDDDILVARAEEYTREGKTEDAIRLYTIGVNRGNAGMMVDLGFIYTDDSNPGFYDLEKGIALYEKASLQDQPVALNNMGYHYQVGKGYPQDIKKALECFKKAADLGEGLAMQNLALLYFYGDYVSQDYDKALEYYKQAEKKLYFNNEKIAEIYYQKSDYENLQRYLRKDKENTYSNIFYGIMHDEGLGVKVNPKKAIKHFEKALEYGLYNTALKRLLYFFKEDPTFADPEKFKYWKEFGEENEMDI